MKEKPDSNLIALIDGDELVFKAAYSCQKTRYDVRSSETYEVLANFKYKKEATLFSNSVDGETELFPIVNIRPDAEAIDNLRTMINTIKLDLETRNYSIFLGGDNNFRREVSTILPYKGQRAEKPHHYHTLRSYLVDEEFATVTSNQEADDALGIMMTIYNREGKFIPICVSQDKDLNMIPGWHYNLNNREKRYITEDEAIRFFYKQLLAGDTTTDNIPGIKGISLDTAEKIFTVTKAQTPEEYYKVVRENYKKAIETGKFPYKTEKSIDDILLEIGNLLWIRRETDQKWVSPINL